MNSVKAVFWGFLPLLLFVICAPELRPQDSFSQGEELFIQNDPQGALKYLEEAVAEDPAHVQAFLYLGIVYLQLNRADDAIATYQKILPRAGAETARIAYNLGNACFSKGDFALALQYYTEAISSDPSYSSAYLNRANTLVKTGELENAIGDYETYLSLEGGSPQKEQVESLMIFIREEFAQAEQRRILGEDSGVTGADRRERLILEVSESLRSFAEDSRELSSGFEAVIQDYEDEDI